VYEQYQNAADALRHERSGRRHAEAVLERVLFNLFLKILCCTYIVLCGFFSSNSKHIYAHLVQLLNFCYTLCLHDAVNTEALLCIFFFTFVGLCNFNWF
jgi:hypothetical protein